MCKKAGTSLFQRPMGGHESFHCLRLLDYQEKGWRGQILMNLADSPAWHPTYLPLNLGLSSSLPAMRSERFSQGAPCHCLTARGHTVLPSFSLGMKCKKLILLAFLIALTLSEGKLQQLPPPPVVTFARTYILAPLAALICLSCDAVPCWLQIS